MAANRGMQIALKTKLGSCALNINATLRNLSDEMLTKLIGKGVQYIAWHDAPSKMFSKDEAFKRDADFSPEFAAHVAKFLTAQLDPYFEQIKIGTEKYVKAEKVVDYAKLSDEQKAKIRAQVLAELESEKSVEV